MPSCTYRYKIGIDASVLSDPLTGIGRYTFEVLSRLVLSPDEWILYSHRPLLGDWNRSNIRLCVGKNFPRRFFRNIWSQTILPIRTEMDGIDLFWSPAHRLPIFISNRIARVVTIHDMVWKYAPSTMHPITRELDRIMMPIAVRMADQIIAVSDNTKNDILCEMPIDVNKIKSIHNGFTQFKESSTSINIFEALNLSLPYILFVGTLEPRKNLSRLLEAYSRLPAPIREKTPVVIVGSKGWGGVDIKKLTIKLGISENVRSLGYINDIHLSQLYANALFLAMPSLYEGSGLPLLEAMSYGVPVLTSNCSSMPEVTGNAGYLIDPEDVESITWGLLELITNNHLRKKLSELSLRRSQCFNWDTTAEQTLKVFELAIKTRKIINFKSKE